jgi:hypothetical protein
MHSSFFVALAFFAFYVIYKKWTSKINIDSWIGVIDSPLYKNQPTFSFCRFRFDANALENLQGDLEKSHLVHVGRYELEALLKREAFPPNRKLPIAAFAGDNVHGSIHAENIVAVLLPDRSIVRAALFRDNLPQDCVVFADEFPTEVLLLVATDTLWPIESVKKEAVGV